MVEEQASNHTAQAAFAAMRSEHVDREALRPDLPILRAKRSAILRCLAVKHPIVGTRGARDVMKGGKIESDLVPTYPGAEAPVYSNLRWERTTVESDDIDQFRNTRPVHKLRHEFIDRPLGVTLNPLRTEEMAMVAMASDGTDPWNSTAR
jgi:hypothetical protein